jgi:hypothetical protein
MMKKVYVLVREDSHEFIGVWDSREKAEQVAKVFRVPTEVICQFVG